MPRNPRSNSSTKKNDDRRGSRADDGMKSRDSRGDDRETRQGRGANGNSGNSRKSGGRTSNGKREH